MARKRISKEVLERCVRAGMGVSEIARELGASKSTISERCKGLLKQKLHSESSNEDKLKGGPSFKEIDLELSNTPYEEGPVKRYEGEFISVSDNLVKINGVEFLPHSEIGFKSDLVRKPIEYKFNYFRIAELIASFGWPEVDTFRALILNDLWFVVFFVVKPFVDAMGMAKANHPFTVKICQEVEDGPKDFTLDIWARFHFKSSIITIGETIKYQLKNRDHSTGIFSHKAPVAKDFLFSIKSIFENEKILAACFPDVVWAEPKKESPQWSLDEGIILKRDTNRKESSVAAHGLLEGQPTGLHYQRRVYDDVSTLDVASNPDIVEKVKHAFDTSQNLKTLVGSHHRVTGTFFSHIDPLLYIRDKKDLDGNPKYLLRFRPATEDGTATGNPVLMTQEALDELKGDSSFNCQQLLDPTPSAEQRLNPDFLQKIEPGSIPKDCFKFMLIDQAGDSTTNRTRNTDPWAMAVFGVEPFIDEEVGQSKIFILDLWVEVCGESEGIERVVQMYIDAGILSCCGIEKVGLSSTHVHIANALRAKGRQIEFSDDRRSSGILLRPSGRGKKKFIESALAWPLNNSKWFYSSEVSAKYIDRLKQEMTNFPLWHDDTLNVCAYLYDVIRDYSFPRRKAEEELERERLIRTIPKQPYDVLHFGLKGDDSYPLDFGLKDSYDPSKF